MRDLERARELPEHGDGEDAPAALDVPHMVRFGTPGPEFRANPQINTSRMAICMAI